MNVLVKVIALLIFVICVQGIAVRFDNFEPRRPIKYAFHLLELKAEFNPLLYPIYLSGKVCSSKVGPFCSITGHESLKTYEIKQTTPEIQNLKMQLLSSIKYTYQTYQSVQKSQNQMFLIRTGTVNYYDNFLKKQIGDMSKQQMLSPTKFKNILQQ